MNFLLYVVFSLLCLTSVGSARRPAKYKCDVSSEIPEEIRFKRPGEEVMFYDNFTDFDLSVWEHEITMSGGGNWEFEYYTNNRSNSYVRDGILYLRPTLTADNIGSNNLQNGFTMDLWGSVPADVCTSNSFYGCLRTSGAGGNILNPIQSARIRTVNSFNFKYGRVEVKAKLPLGDWIWPAIWLLPTFNQYGQWPASGEIDFIESRGNQNYQPGGVNSFGSTLHWGPFFSLDEYQLTHETFTLQSGDFSDGFHVFGLVWTNESLYTYLDTEDQIVLKVPFSEPFWELGGWSNSSYNNPWQGRGNSAPFDQDFFLLLNVAVGGTNGYFPDGQGNKPWSDSSPNAVNEFYSAINQWYPTWNGEDSAMQIDWIEVSTFT